MCYLSQVKHCKPSTLLFLNYVKQNITSVLYFVFLQNANNAIYLLNHVTHKTINEACFNKHKALSAMCYLNQVNQYKTTAGFYLNCIKDNTNNVFCFTTHVKQNSNNAM